MDIKPIRNEADYQAALEEIEALWSAAPGTEAEDRLEILTLLAESYEEKNHAIDPPDPIDAILFRVEQQELSRRDLETYLGTRARVSEILNRKRSLTLPMIRRLHEGLKIPAEILIRSAPLAHQR